MTSVAQHAMSDKSDDLDRLAPLGGSTPESAAHAKKVRDQERAQANREAGGVLRFSEDGPVELASDELIDQIKALASNVRPFPLRDVNELFTAPSAISRYHALQMAESEAAEEVADRIAEVVYGADGVTGLESKRDQANCRFQGVAAVRLSHDCWRSAAMGAAIDQCFEWMKTEGGRRFAGAETRELIAIATMLAPKVITAYLSLAEGTRALEPGRYLAIVKGEQQ